MALILIIVQFLLTLTNQALSLTQGSEYKYMYDNNETCIDVKMDVLFTLSNGNETVRFDGSNFTVRSGDCATVGEYQSVLTLTNSNEDFLILTFIDLPDLSVNMSLMFTFAPFEFFPGTPIATSTNLLDTADLNLGRDTQLYQCIPPQRITLIGELEDTIYTMDMDMSGVQIQAFNIRNGKLSTNVFECLHDKCTLQTREFPVTTFWPSNVTVDAYTTASTYMSTIPVSPQTYSYKVTENSIACLIIEGHFQLIVT
ncbi:uncharacterized protein LOC134275495 [Saccostrea cucullata]|uniref:uncharacterized protein LOC134275495 n=1 Tax=Saccostrea cuccullata TaxID=36930 RepID=UPI002ED64026